MGRLQVLCEKMAEIKRMYPIMEGNTWVNSYHQDIRTDADIAKVREKISALPFVKEVRSGLHSGGSGRWIITINSD